MTRRDVGSAVGLGVRDGPLGRRRWAGMGIAFPCVIGYVDIQSLSKSAQDTLLLTGDGGLLRS